MKGKIRFQGQVKGKLLTSAHPAAPKATSVQHAHKRGLREHIVQMLYENRRNRAELADQIVLLLDGAVTEAYLKGVADPVAAAKRATATLLRATQ